MQKTIKVALTCGLLMSISSASVTMANPIQFDTKGLTQVETSGTEKAWVGEWKGDDTVIMDPLGNRTTYGELKKFISVVLPPEGVKENLLLTELIFPKFKTKLFWLKF